MTITEAESSAYIENAIKRIESGRIQAGSYIVGVFGKSAGLYEAIMRSKLRSTLGALALEYDRTIRPQIKGNPAFHKLSLGMVAFSWKMLNEPSLDYLRRGIPSTTERVAFLKQLQAVNDTWVGVKHEGLEISGTEAVKHLKMMVSSLNTVGQIRARLAAKGRAN